MTTHKDDLLARVHALIEEGDTQAAVALAAQALVTAAPALQAQLLIEMSEAQRSRGDHAEALRASVRACEIAEALGDRGTMCDGLVHTAAVLRSAGDLPTAMTTLEQAEALALQAGDTLRLGRVLRVVGVVSSMLGRHQHAMSSLNDAAAHLATAGAVHDHNDVQLSTLKARIRRVREQPHGPATAAEAESLLQDCLRVADESRTAGQMRLEAMALGNHAITLNYAGRWREAITALEGLIERYRALEMWPNIGLSHVELGVAHEALGEHAQARAQYLHALSILRESGWHSDRIQAFEGLARVEEAAGDPAAALQAIKDLRAQEKHQSDEAARQAVVQRELRIELARLTSQWARQASTDALTGLANRRALSQWLQERWARVEQGRGIVVVLLDLDHFKSINDRFGHDTGDEVLCAVARVLEAHCRISDLAVRYGGEEFLLAMSDIERADALRASERLLAAVAGHEWVRVHADLHVTTSIGLADSAEVLDAAALLTLADKRLYAAKYGGRNRVVAAG